jgi:hypothetical protein
MSLASGGSPTLGAALVDCAAAGPVSAAAMAMADVRQAIRALIFFMAISPNIVSSIVF